MEDTPKVEETTEQTSSVNEEQDKKKSEFLDKYRALAEEYGFDFYPVLDGNQFSIFAKIVVIETPKKQSE